MRPEDLLYWLKARPFRPFTIRMLCGAEYDIAHPEFVRVMRTSFVLFQPTADQAEVFDRAEMLNLQLIEKINATDGASAA